MQEEDLKKFNEKLGKLLEEHNVSLKIHQSIIVVENPPVEQPVIEETK